MPDAGLLEVEVVRGQAGARQWQCWHTRGDKLYGQCRQLTRGHHYTPLMLCTTSIDTNRRIMVLHNGFTI